VVVLVSFLVMFLRHEEAVMERATAAMAEQRTCGGRSSKLAGSQEEQWRLEQMGGDWGGMRTA